MDDLKLSIEKLNETWIKEKIEKEFDFTFNEITLKENEKN